MKVIGIIYRYEKDDYEIMLTDFSKEDDEKIKEITTPYVDNDKVSCARDNARIDLVDANIEYWEDSWYYRDKYYSTNNNDVLVTLDEIFKRYLEINGTHDGFEEYVNSGFVNGNEVEYRRYEL